jgi:hypothetical protein
MRESIVLDWAAVLTYWRRINGEMNHISYLMRHVPHNHCFDITWPNNFPKDSMIVRYIILKYGKAQRRWRVLDTK